MLQSTDMLTEVCVCDCNGSSEVNSNENMHAVLWFFKFEI